MNPLRTRVGRNSIGATARLVPTITILLLLAICLPEATTAQDDPLFTRLDSAESGITFANHVIEDEIFNINT